MLCHQLQKSISDCKIRNVTANFNILQSEYHVISDCKQPHYRSSNNLLIFTWICSFFMDYLDLRSVWRSQVSESTWQKVYGGSNYDSLFVRTVAFPVQVAYWNQRGHSPLRIQCPMSILTSGPETWPWGPVGW